MTELPFVRTAEGSPRPGAAAAVLAIGLALAVLLAVMPFEGPLPAALGIGLYAVVEVWVIDRVAARHPHPQFGLGNLVTLFRAGGAAVIVALAFEPELLAGPRAWAAVAASGALLSLDGIDGWLARQQRTVSDFGARFDMEIDTLLTLALAVLVIALGKIGPWVLALGLMRYAFVAAGGVWPRLARDLPSSQRRKTVCVMTVAALVILLAPTVQPPLAVVIAVVAVGLLGLSFAIDLRWLLRRP